MGDTAHAPCVDAPCPRLPAAWSAQAGFSSNTWRADPCRGPRGPWRWTQQGSSAERMAGNPTVSMLATSQGSEPKGRAEGGCLGGVGRVTATQSRGGEKGGEAGRSQPWVPGVRRWPAGHRQWPGAPELWGQPASGRIRQGEGVGGGRRRHHGHLHFSTFIMLSSHSCVMFHQQVILATCNHHSTGNSECNSYLYFAILQIETKRCLAAQIWVKLLLAH